jgi:hypothetical protein
MAGGVVNALGGLLMIYGGLREFESVLGNLPSYRGGYELAKPTRDRSFRNCAFDLIPFHL